MNRDEAKEVFQSEALRAVVNDWLGSCLGNETPDLSKMTENQVKLYKSSAKRVLESRAYQGERDRIIEQTKTKIALQSRNETETAFARGVCMGLKLLEEALTILAPEANRKREEE